MFAIIAAFLIAVLQTKFGLLKTDQTWIAGLANAAPYLALLVVFLAVHFFQASWMIHKECNRKDVIREIQSIRQAGEIRLVAMQAQDLAMALINSQGAIRAANKDFSRSPLDPSHLSGLKPDLKACCEIACLQRLYQFHRSAVLAAISGTSFASPVLKYPTPSDKTLTQIVEIVQEHKTLLDSQAAALLKPFEDKEMISSMDHTC